MLCLMKFTGHSGSSPGWAAPIGSAPVYLSRQVMAEDQTLLGHREVRLSKTFYRNAG